MVENNQIDNQTNLQSIILKCDEFEKQQSIYLRAWFRNQVFSYLAVFGIIFSLLLLFMPSLFQQILSTITLNHQSSIPNYGLILFSSTFVLSIIFLCLLYHHSCNKIDQIKLRNFEVNALYAYRLYDLCDKILANKDLSNCRKYRSELKKGKHMISHIRGSINEIEPDNDKDVGNTSPLKSLIPLNKLDLNLYKMFRQSFNHSDPENVKHIKEISKYMMELFLDEKFDKIQIINEKIQKNLAVEK